MYITKSSHIPCSESPVHTATVSPYNLVQEVLNMVWLRNPGSMASRTKYKDLYKEI